MQSGVDLRDCPHLFIKSHDLCSKVYFLAGQRRTIFSMNWYSVIFFAKYFDDAFTLEQRLFVNWGFHPCIILVDRIMLITLLQAALGFQWPGRMMFWILQQCIPPAVVFMGKVPEMEMIFCFHGDSLIFGRFACEFLQQRAFCDEVVFPPGWTIRNVRSQCRPRRHLHLGTCMAFFHFFSVHVIYSATKNLLGSLTWNLKISHSKRRFL